ncbi:hypothetical protein ACIPYQ_23400 [Streptomyces sp. NPDC090045]|uniref:hypothetical protein n=1 Tax=Streptomyces sp. NPDC090045 TaxID=3365927 RepID=UPI00380BA078
MGQFDTATEFTVTVTTTQVAKQHPIRIILPPGYWDDPARRYPVLYFLHSSTAMITVIPDGGPRGWYANWPDENTGAGAQNWETFHLDQVIRFIDDNLRTIALFGSPYPVFTIDLLWNEADPAAHMSRLAGIGISIYTGSGPAIRSHRSGMPYYYVGYGNGAGSGTRCDGHHNAGCWAQDLVDYIPRLERAFAAG